ncbi:MAG: hypothetical protein COB45_00605 [Gammaproteobacteria bacterium]|nr:MAG: hypothetical protein COB45_00605 [Gammaproteobacteria bacterium]PHR84760.1 MAG: hypothetical protein COA59_05145 [Colwellia sp.]
MKFIKATLTASALLLTGLSLSGCENTSVSGSVSYGVGMGYGYPMYYGGGYRHTNITVVRPPRNRRSGASRPRRN